VGWQGKNVSAVRGKKEKKNGGKERGNDFLVAGVKKTGKDSTAEPPWAGVRRNVWTKRRATIREEAATGRQTRSMVKTQSQENGVPHVSDLRGGSGRGGWGIGKYPEGAPKKQR